MVFTAPIDFASSDNSSKKGIMDVLYGIVMFRPLIDVFLISDLNSSIDFSGKLE